MLENLKLRPHSVIGPLGEELTLEGLPAPETQRWVPRRKAEVSFQQRSILMAPPNGLPQPSGCRVTIRPDTPTHHREDGRDLPGQKRRREGLSIVAR